MKKICLIALAIIFFAMSCKKEKIADEIPYVPSGGTVTQQDGIIYNAVTDIDGHFYDAVKIGSKVWMIQNLKTSRFADGEDIPMGGVDEFSEDSPYRYAPDANSMNVARYGYLYNWPAVMHGESSSGSSPSGVQGICPKGWHVPSKAEWDQLVSFVGTKSEFQCDENRNNIAKSLASTSGWQECGKNCAVGNNQQENNSTHFCAYPTGFGGSDINNNFGRDAYFWTCTESGIWHDLVLDFELDYYSALTYSGYGYYKYKALAVRCVRD
jgi:uncharacterized protein (TIGR02145 family)